MNMPIRLPAASGITRPNFITASLALIWSAGAEAMPGRPEVDPVEAYHEQVEPDRPVEVPVSWVNWHGDPASSVQYRVNGDPILSRAVDKGAPEAGEATLTLYEPGDYEFTVALCNVDGCTESEAAWVTVADIDVVRTMPDATARPPTAAEVDALLDQITVSTEALAARYGATEHVSYAVNPAPSGQDSLGTLIGKSALSGFIKGGGRFAFERLMEHLGLAPDAYAEVKDALDSLNGKVDQLTRDIEALHDETVWQGFLNQHKDANNAANLIYANFGYVTVWIDQGIEVSAEDWRAARENIANAVTILAGAQSNPAGGIIDARHGAVDQLMRAIPQRVATVTSYWPLVDEYRDYYRAAIATGFLGLDLVADHFDGSGITRLKADHALEAGRRAVRTIYAYGVSPVLPKDPEHSEKVLDMVQSRHATRAYASPAFAKLNGVYQDFGTEEVGTDAALEEHFEQIIAQYRPEAHGGMTLEEARIAAGLPTKFVRDDKWRVYQSVHGDYRIQVYFGTIKANEWKRYVTGFSMAYPTREAAETAMEEIRAQALGSGGLDLPYDGSFAATHFRRGAVAKARFDNSILDDIEQMVGDYRPEHHDGRTLEQLLSDGGIPTTYLTTQRREKSALGGSLSYDQYAVVKRIVGNQLKDQEVFILNVNHTYDRAPVFYEQLNKIIDKDGGLNLSDGTLAVAYLSEIDLTDQLSHGGHAADFSETAIDNAAFGEDAP